MQQVQELLERMERQQGGAEMRLLFGEPVTQGSRTVVPVARVMRGFGWGMGEGRQRGREQEGEDSQGWGGGNAGFLRARPVAVVEVTPERSRVIPVVDVTRIATAGMLLAAWNVFWIMLTLRARRHS